MSEITSPRALALPMLLAAGLGLTAAVLGLPVALADAAPIAAESMGEAARIGCQALVQAASFDLSVSASADDSLGTELRPCSLPLDV